MNKKEGSAVIKFIAVIIVAPIIWIINGFVFSKLWLWFITPMFNLRGLTIVESICFMLIVLFLKGGKAKKAKAKKYDFWEDYVINITIVLLKACLYLFFGWVLSNII